MFHFRLKSDKKPDGTRISPIQHVDYINVISSSDKKDACKGQKTLLYKTDEYGVIRNTAKGIEVTEKASPTTLAVALMLADETMKHKPLIISGSTQ